MPTLAIQLLGDFRLTLDGVLITTVNSPRLQSLFAYLVLHREAPQSRQQLAFHLWPDSSESHARTNLRSLFHDLRQTLPLPDCFLLSDPLTLQWRSDAPYTLDVVDFENSIALAASIEDWQAAVDLYHGDLLPSSYDDWILAERDRLHQKFLEALEHLSELQEQAGDYQAAMRQAQRLLQAEPLREDVYRRLMRLHALNGDRAGVLRVYHTCATVLERELSAEPSPETREAYDQCLRLRVPTAPIAPARVPSRSPKGNLPAQLTRFIGRGWEKHQVEMLVAKNRLVTLSGAGGVGKTRLALAVATELRDSVPDGAWWVDLAPLADVALLPQQIATALELREEQGRPLLTTLIDHLRAQELLLVLDNCEHMVEAVGRLAETLLRAAPKLHLLVTSRESLRVTAECLWHVPCLSIPAELNPGAADEMQDLVKTLLQYEAVSLFVDRATAALPIFGLTQDNASAVAQICRRLDGIPLAIELAAARIKLLTANQIADRLDDCFRLLTLGSRTALPHHQTLRSAMDWSYQFLSAREQVVHRRLAVFAGGFSVEAAEMVCSDQDVKPGDVLDLLSSLQDKSLVEVEQHDHEALSYLLETVRQYALDKLTESGEAPMVRDRHLDFYLKWVEEREPRLASQDEKTVAELTREVDNFRAALEWGQRDAGSWDKGLRLSSALAKFWEKQNALSEGREWLRRFLALADHSPDVLARARALCAAGHLAYLQSDHAEAIECYRRCLSIEGQDAAQTAQTHLDLGVVYYRRADHMAATDHFHKTIQLGETIPDPVMVALAQMWLGIIYHDTGDLERAEANHQRSLAAFRLANRPNYIAAAVGNLARVHYQRTDYDQAIEDYRQAIALLETLGNRYNLSVMYNNLSEVFMDRGDFCDAVATLAQSLEMAESLHNRLREAIVLANLAACHLALGDTPRARQYVTRAVERVSTEQGPQHKGTIYRIRGEIRAACGERESARADFEEARQLLEPLREPSRLARLYRSYGRLLGEEPDTRAQGTQYLKRALALFESLGSRKEEEKTKTLLRGTEREGTPLLKGTTEDRAQDTQGVLQ